MSTSLLPRSGVLTYMDDESRLELERYGRLMTTRPAQVIIEEGAVNTRLYVVLNGLFHVTTRVRGVDVRLDSVGPGDCLGEVALFTPDLASATVTADEDVPKGELWTVDADALQQFLAEFPDGGCAAILGINVLLSRRLKRAHDVLKFHEIVPGFIAVRAKQRAETKKLAKFEKRTN